MAANATRSIPRACQNDGERLRMAAHVSAGQSATGEHAGTATNALYSSQVKKRAARSGAAIAHTISTPSSSNGNDRLLFSAGAHGLRERGGRQCLGEHLERVGQAVEWVRHAAEEQQHEEQAVGEREVRLRAQRSRHQHPDPRERDGSDEQERERQQYPRRRRAPPEREPGGDDRDRLDDLEHEHVEGLGGEQPRA